MPGAALFGAGLGSGPGRRVATPRPAEGPFSLGQNVPPAPPGHTGPPPIPQTPGGNALPPSVPERFLRGVRDERKTLPNFGAPGGDEPEQPGRGGPAAGPAVVAPPAGTEGPLRVDPELARLREFTEERKRDAAKFNAPFNAIGELPELVQERLASFLPAGVFEGAVATGTAGKKSAGLLVKDLIFGGSLGAGEEDAIRREQQSERVRRFFAGLTFLRGARPVLAAAGVVATGGPAVEILPMWTSDP